MTQESDGGEESLAPVIPLFGSRTPRPAPHATARALPEEMPAPSSNERRADELGADGAGAGQCDVGEDEHGVHERGAHENGAGADAGTHRDDEAHAEPAEEWHTTWREPGRGGLRRTPPAPAGGVRFAESADDDDAPSEQEIVEAAEASMIKALRRRSISESEARSRLLREDVPRDAADEIVARFVDLGYLDDTALAEQIVHAAVTRKSQGGRAIAQALHARGISREVVEIALESLPDDEEDRALEYARGKARALLRVDDDTALRRLSGQLARRGFGGSLAMSAARRALDEARGPSSTVRFR